MGNLDFLEKKPRIAYTLSWDGVTEGKVTNTTGMRKVYKISSEIFNSRPDIVWTPTGSSGIPCNTPENIRLEKNYRFRNIEGVSNVSVSVLKENTKLDTGSGSFNHYWRSSVVSFFSVTGLENPIDGHVYHYILKAASGLDASNGSGLSSVISYDIFVSAD